MQPFYKTVIISISFTCMFVMFILWFDKKIKAVC